MWVIQACPAEGILANDISMTGTPPLGTKYYKEMQHTDSKPWLPPQKQNCPSRVEIGIAAELVPGLQSLALQSSCTQ